MLRILISSDILKMECQNAKMHSNTHIVNNSYLHLTTIKTCFTWTKINQIHFPRIKHISLKPQFII